MAMEKQSNKFNNEVINVSVGGRVVAFTCAILFLNAAAQHAYECSASVWNNLTEDDVNCQTIAQFKAVMQKQM